MSHLNPSPNQTKTKTQSERQNRGDRNREERRERIGEWKKRERPLFLATHHALSTSIPSPQPTTHMLLWPVTTPPLRHNHRTTLQPSKNPCHKTHNPQPTTPMPPLPWPSHQHSVATIKRDWQREPWFDERGLSF